MADFTKKAIKETFIKMLNEYPLSQITVKDISKELLINRNTFYYHYHDIPQLIEEIITEEADRIISKYDNIDSMEKVFEAVLDFAEQNRRAILHIYNSVNRDIFERYLWKVCEYAVISYGNVINKNKISEDDKETLVMLYKCELFGIAVYWMNNGATDDLKKSIARICELRKGVIEETLKRCK